VPVARRISLGLLTTLASLWAASLVVLGMLLVARGVNGWVLTSTGIGQGPWRALGVAFVAGGQFVFMILVADRVFPRAGRRPSVWLTEIAVALAGLLSLVIALASGIVQLA
jgi:hypothetical protein